MRFAQQLEEYQLGAWKEHYIPYKHLKNWLKVLEENLGAQTCADSGVTDGLKPSGSNPNFERKGDSPPTSPKKVLYRSRKGSRSWPKMATAWDAMESEEEAWRKAVEKCALHAGKFVEMGLTGLRRQLAELAEMRERMQPLSRNQFGDEFLDLRVLDALARVKDGTGYLKGFAEINHAALYKIMKKYDKQFKSEQGITVWLPQLVAASGLGNMKRFELMEKEVRDASLLMSQCKGLDASQEVASLVAGLHLTRGKGQMLYFFLGSSVALFLSIIVLILLPPRDDSYFYLPYFLSPFPVFQVGLTAVLSLWAMGFVARACEEHGINHKFILDLDPRCRVGSRFFISRAAALTTAWIFIFGMYVVDYKWRIFRTYSAEYGELGSAWHFFVYPSSLIVVSAVVFLWPSRACSLHYWGSFLKSLGRTAFAPFFAVSFADNVVGDALTSMAKPLQQIPAAACYFATAHVAAKQSRAYLTSHFEEHGDMCPAWEHSTLVPFIAAMPFVFRALQCLRRFRDTRERKHLLNFGKYMASILVVVVSATFAKSFVLVCVSVFATMYAAAWDITMDWGLGIRDLLRFDCDLLNRFLGRNAKDTPCQFFQLQSSSFGTTGSEHLDRHFSPITYCVIALFDIVARSTWVLTLMPSHVLTSNAWAWQALAFTTAAVEILRRSIWAVLRIEYEQVSNAGGFRTLLWVPSKLNAGFEIEGFGICTPAPENFFRSDGSALEES